MSEWTLKPLMINWPKVETHKPHMYWRAGRWHVQVSGQTKPCMLGEVLRWREAQWEKARHDAAVAR